MILDREGIEDILPHRKPFLFVDAVIEIEFGKYIEANYSFPPDAYFFEGHFPGNPIVPGVLLIEAMAQAAAILAYKTDSITWRDRGALLLRIDNAIFRKQVKPGEKIEIEARIEHRRLAMIKFKAHASVSGKRCVEAVIMAQFTNPAK